MSAKSVHPLLRKILSGGITTPTELWAFDLSKVFMDISLRQSELFLPGEQLLSALWRKALATGELVVWRTKVHSNY